MSGKEEELSFLLSEKTNKGGEKEKVCSFE